MEIVINHKKTKREIKGAFSICCSKKDLLKLKQAIDDKIEEGFSFGWIDIDEYIETEDSDFNIIKKQKQNKNTAPIYWD